MAALLNLPPNHLRNQLGRQLAQCARAGLALHDVHHLLPDLPDLRAGRVRCLADLVRPPLGEGNAEESEDVVVCCLYHYVRLNQRLPFPHQRTQLVGCEVETVEVGEAIFTLDFVDTQLDLAEGMILILLEVGEGDLEYSACAHCQPYGNAFQFGPLSPFKLSFAFFIPDDRLTRVLPTLE